LPLVDVAHNKGLYDGIYINHGDYMLPVVNVAHNKGLYDGIYSNHGYYTLRTTRNYTIEYIVTMENIGCP
jgi:hypothetical protein